MATTPNTPSDRVSPTDFESHRARPLIEAPAVFKSTYAAMKDAEILHLANSATLTTDLKALVHDEIRKRNLSIPSTGDSQGSKLKGVGGWLKLLVYALVFVGPIVTLFVVISTLAQTWGFLTRLPLKVSVVILVDSFLSLALTSFGVYAGIALWRIKEGAVSIARYYFAGVLAYGILAFLMVLWLEFPATGKDSVTTQAAGGLLRSIVAASIWLSYLSKSKRVAATYSSAASSATT